MTRQHPSILPPLPLLWRKPPFEPVSTARKADGQGNRRTAGDSPAGPPRQRRNDEAKQLGKTSDTY
jgi:hypothetical protein